MVIYFVKTLGSHFRAGRSLYFLTVFGVALGVASVLSIQIINRNALAAFRGGIQAVSGEADFSVMGRTPSIPETHLPPVLADPDVTAAWPVYRVEVSLTGTDAVFLDVVGLDLFASMEIPWRGDPAARTRGVVGGR